MDVIEKMAIFFITLKLRFNHMYLHNTDDGLYNVQTLEYGKQENKLLIII